MSCSGAPTGVLQLPRELYRLRSQLCPPLRREHPRVGALFTLITKDRPQYRLLEGLSVFCGKLFKSPGTGFQQAFGTPLSGI